MATRRTPRAGLSAKVTGALLIALALLIGISLVPPQTAPVPRFVAAHLGRITGAGLPLLPWACGLVGLIFFVRESFRLSARVSGVLLGYVVGLVVLHLRYPAGSELLAAAARKGGGYTGALVEIALRRTVGEPGLWTVTALGALAAALLFSGRSATDLLLAIGGVGGVAGAAAVAAGRDLMIVAGTTLAAAGRGLAGLLARGVTQAAVAVQTGVRELVRTLPAMNVPRSAADVAYSPAGGMAPAAEGETAPSPRIAAGEVIEAPDAFPPHADSVEGSEMDAAEPGAALVAAPERVERLRDSGAGRRRRKPLIEQAQLPFSIQPRQGYTRPPLSLLDNDAAGKARAGKVDPEEVARNLERTLASFGVEAKVIRWEIGPVVTRYELQPAPGVKVQRITSLQNDIALALAASSVRLEAPIPGKAAIGVELPNDRPGLVHLREILTSPEFQRSQSPLTVSVGKGIAGQPVVADLVAMPHLLIAGATGAGKSVALNAMIATILFGATPEQVRFLMIDPKRVELTNYNGIPHLLSPVVTGPREAGAKLRWAIQEMEARYALFATDGVRNIQAFNAQHPDRPLAYIVIIIDELADLMMVAPSDFEEIICRLAQMTRAVGIHLVVATQRPSVDVITGLIKANIPSRIAFAVTSQVDSRTILDHPGAEKLLGRGDMLFSPIGAVRPMRIQGSFISDAESERLVEFWRAQGQPEYVEELLQAGEEAEAEKGEDEDSLLADAARLVVRAGYGSVSLLQRKMRIGYVRAARLVDHLEAKGIVGPTQGSSPREVLVGINDLERVLRHRVPAGKAAQGAQGASPVGAPPDPDEAG
ncbi:MAG TPA: DNA translocase FtsK [bacterium]|nr:DNA translocase FtsK [bacterium]